MNEFEYKQKYIVQKLNSVILLLKKELKTRSEIKLSLEENAFNFRVIGNSKIFLVCPFIENKNRLLEIVVACATSMDMSPTYKESLDEDFISHFLDFICSTNNIYVKAHEQEIILIGNDSSFQVLFDKELGKISSYIIARSLCVLLAACGKEVASNMDSTKLNNHGCVSVYLKDA